MLGVTTAMGRICGIDPTIVAAYLIVLNSSMNQMAVTGMQFLFPEFK